MKTFFTILAATLSGLLFTPAKLSPPPTPTQIVLPGQVRIPMPAVPTTGVPNFDANRPLIGNAPAGGGINGGGITPVNSGIKPVTNGGINDTGKAPIGNAPTSGIKPTTGGGIPPVNSGIKPPTGGTPNFDTGPGRTNNDPNDCPAYRTLKSEISALEHQVCPQVNHSKCIADVNKQLAAKRSQLPGACKK